MPRPQEIVGADARSRSSSSRVYGVFRVNGLLRRCTAFAGAAVLLFPQFCTPIRATATGLGIPTTTRHPVVGAAAGHVPVRIPVAEPARRTPLPLPALSKVRPPAARGVLAHGVRACLARRCCARAKSTASCRPPARRLNIGRSSARQPVLQSVPRLALPSRPHGAPAGARCGACKACSRRRAPESTHGGGIKNRMLPGGGHVMVNVGTGNILLQDDECCSSQGNRAGLSGARTTPKVVTT